MAWKVYNVRKILGTFVSGDPSVPPTRWWSHLFLLLFWWKMKTIFFARTLCEYRVGYIPQDGKPRLRAKPVGVKMFAVRNGREDRTFFAVNKNGEEVKLDLITQTKEKTPKYLPVL